MKFVTERLILRPWTESDADVLYLYAKDPAVALPSGWLPHTSVENSRDIICTILNKPTVFAVCRKDGLPLGNIHLDFDTALRERDDECELGFWLGKPFWGQGITAEAAREMLRYAFIDCGVHAVWCGYYAGNEQSRRVQEKLGFTYLRTDNVQGKTVHRTHMTKEIWERNYD